MMTVCLILEFNADSEVDAINTLLEIALFLKYRHEQFQRFVFTSDNN